MKIGPSLLIVDHPCPSCGSYEVEPTATGVSSGKCAHCGRPRQPSISPDAMGGPPRSYSTFKMIPPSATKLVT